MAPCPAWVTTEGLVARCYDAPCQSFWKGKDSEHRGGSCLKTPVQGDHSLSDRAGCTGPSVLARLSEKCSGRLFTATAISRELRAFSAEVQVFWSQSCPHCSALRNVLPADGLPSFARMSICLGEKREEWRDFSAAMFARSIW